MSKGVLYKANASTWTKSQAKKYSASTITDGRITHANATTWFDNYPMEQEYTSEFACTWTQGYEVNTKLWEPSWGIHLYSGGNAGFRSYVGFDRNAISNFVTTNGVITKVELLLHLRETSLNGSPTVYFYPAQLTSAPASWNSSAINTSFRTTKQFPNKAYGGYWTTLSNNHVRNTNGTIFGAIALMPKSNTETDWAVFSGKANYTSKLRITVVK